MKYCYLAVICLLAIGYGLYSESLSIFGISILIFIVVLGKIMHLVIQGKL